MKNARKVAVCVALALCVALGMAGCGKKTESKQSREVKEAERYYEKELGLDKEEAKELAQEMYGESSAESEPQGEPEESWDILPEIENGEWDDFKVQFYDMVFKYDGSMTVDDVKAVVENSKAGFELEETFDADGYPIIDEIQKNGNSIYLVWDNEEQYEKKKEFGLYKGDNEDICLTGLAIIDDTSFAYVSGPWNKFKTLNDVLTYLDSNSFIEIEEGTSPYSDQKYWSPVLKPNNNMDVVNTSHYSKHGVQSVDIYFVQSHICENEQELDVKYYSDMNPTHILGVHLNRILEVKVSFDSDGNVSHVERVNMDSKRNLQPHLQEVIIAD